MNTEEIAIRKRVEELNKKDLENEYMTLWKTNEKNVGWLVLHFIMWLVLAMITIMIISNNMLTTIVG